MNTRHKRDAPLIAPTLLAALLTAGCTTVRTAELHSEFPKERAQIERRLQEIMVAAEQKDFDRLDSYHWYGPKFTRFSDSSPGRLDAAATRQLEHDGMAVLKHLRMRIEALKVDVFGPVGIATFILDYSFESGGNVVSNKERTTLVFVNEGGDWKIAHEHLSPIQPANEKTP